MASIHGKHTKRSNGGKLHAPERRYKVTKDTFNGTTSHVCNNGTIAEREHTHNNSANRLRIMRCF